MKAYFPKGFLKPEVFPFLIKNVLQPQPLKPQIKAVNPLETLKTQFATPTSGAAKLGSKPTCRSEKPIGNSAPVLNRLVRKAVPPPAEPVIFS